MELIKKGPWTPEEDSILFNYVKQNGEGHWNSVSHSTGLKRTGKSCRLRWLNYLHPNVRRGNITLQEQLLILDLHSRWGNRWSKIAQFLPGRTDNEIKNYWRTRVQKQAKQLNCDVNSQRFRDAMRLVWIPRLLERIKAADNSSSSSNSDDAPVQLTPSFSTYSSTPSDDSSDLRASSELKLTVTPMDELGGHGNFGSGSPVSGSGWNEGGLGEFDAGWLDLDGVDSSLESLWTEENICFLQQQLFD